MSAEFLPDIRTCGISISSNDASCIGALNSLYRSQSQYAFFTTMLPLSSRRSRTRAISNFAYFASRTPSAMFSKSQNRAMLLMGCVIGSQPALFLEQCVGDAHRADHEADGEEEIAVIAGDHRQQMKVHAVDARDQRRRQKQHR